LHCLLCLPACRAAAWFICCVMWCMVGRSVGRVRVFKEEKNKRGVVCDE
jgi:hypothetical protein